MIPATGAPQFPEAAAHVCLREKQARRHPSDLLANTVFAYIEQWITSCVACPRSAVRPRRSLLRPPIAKLRMARELCDRVIIPRIGYT